MFRRVVMLAMAVVFGVGSQANGQVLPDSLQDCFDSGQCNSLTMVFENDEFSSYSYFDTSANALMTLNRYSIGDDSGTNSEFESSSSFTPHIGAVWLSGQNRLPPCRSQQALW